MLKIQIFICLFLLSLSWNINSKLLTPAQDFPINGFWQKQTSPATTFEFMTVANKYQYYYQDTLGIQVQGFYEYNTTLN